jgi:hypothetical protein
MQACWAELLLYDWRFTVRLGAKPLVTHDQSLFFWQLNPYGHNPCVRSSLTRGWVCLLWICLAFVKSTLAVKVKSKSHYYRRTVGQSVLVSSPIWGQRQDFCYCQTFAVVSMGGALSDERSGLSFVAVIVSGLSHLYAANMYMLFTVLPV